MASQTIADGDLVKLDLTAEKDGFVADVACTVRVGTVYSRADALASCAQTAFQQGLKAAVLGNRACEIGRSVEREVNRCGFTVIRELCGYGIGRTIHEEPCIPNHFDRRFRSKLTHGLVITIEPMISAGSCAATLQPDNWTVSTADGSLCAHYEHTLLITKRGPILLTAP